MADTELSNRGQISPSGAHGEQGLEHEKGNEVITNENIDSLGHVGATRQADESDYVTWKTWCVIVVSTTPSSL